MQSRQYLEIIAKQLVEDIRPAAGLKKLTSNSDLLGAYTEAAVRSLVQRIVSPLHVCRGSVTDVDLSTAGEDLRQLDTIIWAPCPAPAIFALGDFGLVPRSSSFGFLEIKRSLYNGVPEELSEKTGSAFVNKYVSDCSRSGDLAAPAALGVVCVKLQSQSLSAIQDLLDAKRAVVLFEEQDGGGWEARPRDVIRLVNRLTQFKFVANQELGTVMTVLNEDLLDDGTA